LGRTGQPWRSPLRSVQGEPRPQGQVRIFKAIKDEMANGGLEGMLHDLLALRLGDWHPRQLYKTAALQEQKQHSLTGLDLWIEGLLQEGQLPRAEGIGRNYPNRALTDDLWASAKEYAPYTNKRMVVEKLKTVFGADALAPFNIQVARGWAFPPLADCRRAWERRYSGSWPWHEDIPEWLK
jgi:hypothetical protein